MQFQDQASVAKADDYVLDCKELNFHLKKIKAWKGKQIFLPHTLAQVIKVFIVLKKKKKERRKWSKKNEKQELVKRNKPKFSAWRNNIINTWQGKLRGKMREGEINNIKNKKEGLTW